MLSGNIPSRKGRRHSVHEQRFRRQNECEIFGEDWKSLLCLWIGWSLSRFVYFQFLSKIILFRFSLFRFFQYWDIQTFYFFFFSCFYVSVIF